MIHTGNWDFLKTNDSGFTIHFGFKSASYQLESKYISILILPSNQTEFIHFKLILHLPIIHKYLHINNFFSLKFHITFAQSQCTTVHSIRCVYSNHVK